jgi:hypothetical protein
LNLDEQSERAGFLFLIYTGFNAQHRIALQKAPQRQEGAAGQPPTQAMVPRTRLDTVR